MPEFTPEGPGRESLTPLQEPADLASAAKYSVFLGRASAPL